MTKTFMPTVKTLHELKEIQIKGLQWTVNHAYNGSPFYRKRLVSPQGTSVPWMI